MKRKIIFLDIDGVLVNRTSLQKRSGQQAEADKPCVEALNHIIQNTEAWICVSSTWRIFGETKIAMTLKDWGVRSNFAGVTPDHTRKVGYLYQGVERGDEIQAWLDDNKNFAGAFVILDDDTDMKHLSHRLIRTKFETGLTLQDAERAIVMLNEL